MAEATDKTTGVAEAVPTVTFTIDGRSTTVPKGTTVLEAARKLRIDIPTFCWHPKLTAAGSCRMCYVEIEKWPKLAISCATEAMEGMVVHTASEKVLAGRRAVIEFTLIDHPLDCPTCDKGGECTLQDLTFAHGLDDSRFDFRKTRFGAEETDTTFDDLKIGPEIVLNRNRCIKCYRCVRANKEAFGEYDLGAYERGNHTEINAAPGREVDNPFSGNLVEICPVGALTNTDWRYQIRVWLTQTASSICPFYSSGSNTILYKNDAQKRIFRVTSRPNDAIDDGWLSDTTRYGYQIATSADRLKSPLIKKEGKQVPATWDEALALIGKRLSSIIDKKGKVCIGGIASPTLDNRSLYSFSKLIRNRLGSNNIDYRSDYRMLPKSNKNPYDVLYGQPFNIADIDSSDTVVVFGSDLLKEHPNEYLRIRRAFNFNNASIFVLNPFGTKAADVAAGELVFSPGTDETAINGICLAAIEANLIDASRVGDLKSKIKPKTSAEAASLCGVDPALFHTIARRLVETKKLTFIGGEILSRSRDREVIAAAVCNLVRLFDLGGRSQVAVLPRYANSRGAELLGMSPDPSAEVKKRLTGFWGTGWPEAAPSNTDSMMINMKKEEVNGCIVLGSNLVMLYPDREFAQSTLEGLEFLVVADLYETETTELADVVLPLAAWVEYDGEYTNLEGRVQKASRALPPSGQSRPAYKIIEQIAEELGGPLFDNDSAADKEARAVLAKPSFAVWPQSYLEVVPGPEEPAEDLPLALFIGDDEHHSGHLTEKSDSLLAFQSEAYVEMSPALAGKLQLENGDSARVESANGKIIVPVRISSWIRTDAVFIPRNFSATPVNTLIFRKGRVDRVKVSKVVE
jgi:NADH-quinone oxidoreductase subunit G